MAHVPAIRVLASVKPAKAALIFLHGLGDTGEGWSWFPQLIKQSRVVSLPDLINYVFPNAPTIPITINNGFACPGWFDIHDLENFDTRADVKGFMDSTELVKSLIAEQVALGVPSERIIIGGFSQGAALALATVGLLDQKIGGCIGLSGFCPQLVIDSLKPGVNADTPIFQAHGTADMVVKYDKGKVTAQKLEKLGFSNYTFKTYPGLGHSADDAELKDVMNFIKSILG